MILFLISAAGTAQGSLPQARSAEIARLYAAGQWNEVIRLAEASPERSADLDYYEGMALAKLDRWRDAQAAFEDGSRRTPRDARFPVELAGVAFKLKAFGMAKHELRRALRLNPRDSYASDFLATLYFLDDNLPAALKYWNRSGKPQIEDMRTEPTPRVDPVLLDHAFTFSRASVLDLREFLSTEARLNALDIFPRYRFELASRQDESFDLLFHPAERNGWGDGTLDGLISLLRGAPYDTVYPEWFNIRRSAINSKSLVRWDPQKRRAFASLSGPLDRNPQWRYSLYLDGRQENWNITKTFFGNLAQAGDVRLEKLSVGATIMSIPSGRWSWQTGVELSYRKYPNLHLPQGSNLAPFFADGVLLKDDSQTDYKLLYLPGKRFTLDSIGSLQLGRSFAPPSQDFVKLQGALAADWYPQARGDDYELTAEFRGGKTFGAVPFDELFELGLERDNDLWLRGHIGTRDGRKGAAPLGRDYALANWTFSRTFYRNAWAQVSLGPFLDSGAVEEPSGLFGSRRWLWDTGAQLKIQLLGGTSLVFWFGKDLRSGHNAFYATSLP